MRFLVLGPLEVVGDDGALLPIAGSKERTIFAYLIARAGLVASIDDLIDELWGGGTKARWATGTGVGPMDKPAYIRLHSR